MKFTTKLAAAAALSMLLASPASADIYDNDSGLWWVSLAANTKTGEVFTSGRKTVGLRDADKATF